MLVILYFIIPYKHLAKKLEKSQSNAKKESNRVVYGPSNPLNINKRINII